MMRRLLKVALRLLPPARRDLGRALLAEANVLPPGRRRAAWLAGGFWFVVREGFVMSITRRSVAWTALIAAIVWLGLTVEIVLTNVVFPSTDDDDGVAVALSYLCVFAALFLIGLVAARTGVGPRGQLLVGLLAGATIGLLTAVTFAVVDNVWLGIVAQQRQKVDGFAGSGAASMRDYVNGGLVGVAVVLPVILGVLGALLGRAGGFAGRPRSHVDGEPRRWRDGG